MHSGDSACSLPTQTIPTTTLNTIREWTVKVAKALNVVGLINIQYAIQVRRILFRHTVCCCLKIMLCRQELIVYSCTTPMRNMLLCTFTMIEEILHVWKGAACTSHTHDASSLCSPRQLSALTFAHCCPFAACSARHLPQQQHM